MLDNSRKERTEGAGSGRLKELGQEEAQVRERLPIREGGERLRTRVPLIDYGVDQIRFFLAVWETLKEQGLPDLAALERAELLSLPECIRRAGTRWRKRLLMESALRGEWSCWQRVLNGRRSDFPGVALPRSESYPVPKLQLGPYPSSERLSRGEEVHLDAEVYPDLGLFPSPIHPMRPLSPGWFWSLHLFIFRISRSRRGLRVIVDPPWSTDLTSPRSALNAIAARLDALADSWSGRVGDQKEDRGRESIGEWRRMARDYREAAERLTSATSRRRAEILERGFSFPGAGYLDPVVFVTEEMPAEIMAQFIGFGLEAIGLLTVREQRQFRQFVEGRYLKDHDDLAPAEAAQFARRVARFRRPLNRGGLQCYESKAIRGIRSSSRIADTGDLPIPAELRVGRYIRRLARRHGRTVRTVYRWYESFALERSRRRGDRRTLDAFLRWLRRRKGVGKFARRSQMKR